MSSDAGVDAARLDNRDRRIGQLQERGHTAEITLAEAVFSGQHPDRVPPPR